MYFYCRFPFLNTPVPFVFVQNRQTTERLLSAGCETLIFYLIARFCQSDHIDFNIKLRLINNQFKVVACVTSKTKLCSLTDCVKKPVSSSLCILVCVCLHENITCECQLGCADAHLMMDCVQVGGSRRRCSVYVYFDYCTTSPLLRHLNVVRHTPTDGHQ